MIKKIQYLCAAQFYPSGASQSHNVTFIAVCSTYNSTPHTLRPWHHGNLDS
jgi:hypothetical protein